MLEALSRASYENVTTGMGANTTSEEQQTRDDYLMSPRPVNMASYVAATLTTTPEPPISVPSTSTQHLPTNAPK